MPLTESLLKAQRNCFRIMNKLRIKYPRNIIIGYININSIKNKFNNFTEVISNKVDIIVTAETNLDSSFPKCQFMVNGFNQPIRLDISSVGGGLQIKNGLISKQLKDLEVTSDIEIIPMEIKTPKQKSL